MNRLEATVKPLEEDKVSKNQNRSLHDNTFNLIGNEGTARLGKKKILVSFLSRTQ